MPRRRRRSGPPPPPRDAWDRLYPTLDLHGETAEPARRRADVWLRQQQLRGEPVVRLITGWGRHSSGPPVLRAEIEALLGTLRGGIVARFEREPGGGAFRVELSRQRAPTAPPARAPDTAARPPQRVPAELRRLAEEALWELGVTPTPELLRTQIERLLAEREGDAG